MSDRRLVMAYADPPYPGQSKKHYADHPDYAGEVDHRELVARLVNDYPDGWALSRSSGLMFLWGRDAAARAFIAAAVETGLPDTTDSDLAFARKHGKP